MEEHPIHELMTTTMESLKEMVEVNTIIGEPVESPDGSVIIPVSKLGFGFAAGGSEFSSPGSNDDSDSDSNQLPFGGGSGGGVSINPVAFLIVNDKETKMIHLDEGAHLYEKIIEVAPQAAEKLQAILKTTNQTKDKKQKHDEQTNYEI